MKSRDLIAKHEMIKVWDAINTNSDQSGPTNSIPFNKAGGNISDTASFVNARVVDDDELKRALQADLGSKLGGLKLGASKFNKVPEEKEDDDDDNKSMKSRKSMHLPTEMRDPDRAFGEKDPVIDSKALDAVNEKIAALKEEVSKIASLEEEITKLSAKTVDLEKADKIKPAQD